MARGFYFGFTIVFPELVRLLSWKSANILSAPDSSGKMSSQGCSAVTRTILSQDSANWWQYAFYCKFASTSTNANQYLSQSLTVAWLIFGSSSTPNLSLATGPILSRDLFYAWASPEYWDSLTSAGFWLRRLSKIDIRLAFLHGKLRTFEMDNLMEKNQQPLHFCAECIAVSRLSILSGPSENKILVRELYMIDPLLMPVRGVLILINRVSIRGELLRGYQWDWGGCELLSSALAMV